MHTWVTSHHYFTINKQEISFCPFSFSKVQESNKTWSFMNKSTFRLLHLCKYWNMLGTQTVLYFTDKKDTTMLNYSSKLHLHLGWLHYYSHALNFCLFVLRIKNTMRVELLPAMFSLPFLSIIAPSWDNRSHLNSTVIVWSLAILSISAFYNGPPITANIIDSKKELKFKL